MIRFKGKKKSNINLQNCRPDLLAIEDMYAEETHPSDHNAVKREMEGKDFAQSRRRETSARERDLSKKAERGLGDGWEGLVLPRVGGHLPAFLDSSAEERCVSNGSLRCGMFTCYIPFHASYYRLSPRTHRDIVKPGKEMVGEEMHYVRVKPNRRDVWEYVQLSIAMVSNFGHQPESRRAEVCWTSLAYFEADLAVARHHGRWYRPTTWGKWHILVLLLKVHEPGMHTGQRTPSYEEVATLCSASCGPAH